MPRGASGSLAAVAEQWLDMGERDRARRVLETGKISIERRYADRFLGQLARLEPDQVLARLQKLPTLHGNPVYRDDELAEVAVQLATDHPAEAEQVFNLRESRAIQRLRPSTYALRLCRRLARVDPPRARASPRR